MTPVWLKNASSRLARRLLVLRDLELGSERLQAGSQRPDQASQAHASDHLLGQLRVGGVKRSSTTPLPDNRSPRRHQPRRRAVGPYRMRPGSQHRRWKPPPSKSLTDCETDANNEVDPGGVGRGRSSSPRTCAGWCRKSSVAATAAAMATNATNRDRRAISRTYSAISTSTSRRRTSGTRIPVGERLHSHSTDRDMARRRIHRGWGRSAVPPEHQQAIGLIGTDRPEREDADKPLEDAPCRSDDTELLPQTSLLIALVPARYRRRDQHRRRRAVAPRAIAARRNGGNGPRPSVPASARPRSDRCTHRWNRYGVNLVASPLIERTWGWR